MLLAPNTLCAMVNFNGSLGGKYGAKTHLSTHLRRRILHAAQGLTMIGGGDGEVVVVVVVVVVLVLVLGDPAGDSEAVGDEDGERE